MPSKLTACVAVRTMRDEFLALAHAYNNVGLYSHAQNAQQMGIMLNEFLHKHQLDAFGWPVESGPDGLLDIDGLPVLTSEIE